MTWTVHPKELDSYVKVLRDLAWSDQLRQLEAVRVSAQQLDVHEGGFARAYHMKGADGASTCLRFWLSEPDSSLLTTYSALEAAPEVCVRSGLPRVQLFPHAISSAADDAIPAVLMDWVEGHSLGECIGRHTGQPANLNSVADALLQLFVRLNAEGTSHGDLRASNIVMQVKPNSVRPSLIDLDSVRWRGGPVLPRATGGNARWRELQRRKRVEPLQHDYLDQALTYLTVVAVAQDPDRWKGLTEVFLTPYDLRGDGDEILLSLERLNGVPSRLAGVVRQVISDSGGWTALPNAMSEAAARHPLEADEFWRVLMARRGAARPPIPTQKPRASRPPSQPTPSPAPAPPSLSRREPSTRSVTPTFGVVWFWILLVIAILAGVGAAWWYST